MSPKTRRSKSPGRRRNRNVDKPRIKEKQWQLPASFTADGTRMATLREVVDPNVPTKSLAELSEDDRVNLVVRRLQMQSDDFKLAMIGVGIIDKNRAIAEVKARSRIGRNLMEIEQRMIDHVSKVGQNRP